MGDGQYLARPLDDAHVLTIVQRDDVVLVRLIAHKGGIELIDVVALQHRQKSVQMSAADLEEERRHLLHTRVVHRDGPVVVRRHHVCLIACVKSFPTQAVDLTQHM